MRSGPALASSSLVSTIDPDSNRSNPVFVGLRTTTWIDSVGCFGLLSCHPVIGRARSWNASGAPTVDDEPRKRVSIGPLMAAPLDPEEYVEAAVRVARRLEKLAFVDGVRAGWLGVTTDHEPMPGGEATLGVHQWSIEPMELGLGDGAAGVALFLARLASVTGDACHRLLAEQAAVGVVEALDVRRGCVSIGAFTGWGGVIYALAHLGVLLESGDYMDRAEALVPLVEALVDVDEALDIQSGSAGAIMGLAALQAVRPSDRIVSVIRACASRLLVRAERLPDRVWLAFRCFRSCAVDWISRGCGGHGVGVVDGFGVDERCGRT